jgi:RimJ/RimL family protein N-acetyltransferase
MQRSWRTDPDKLTFIACLPTDAPVSNPKRPNVVGRKDDAPKSMLGDINLFLTPADEDPKGCIGELELMIAPTEARRRGYGRAALLAFLMYMQKNLDAILQEYSTSLEQASQKSDAEAETSTSKMCLLQLRVKIGSKNEKSINLFTSVGFVKVGEGENYFGEVELVFEGSLGKGRVESLFEKWKVTGYEELEYYRPGEL